MKKYFYFTSLFFALNSYTLVAQKIQTKEVPVQRVSNQLDVSSDDIANKEMKATRQEESPNAKTGQIEKLKSRIHSQKEKLERERLGGELPGDYIAAQEEKIIKMERKLEALLNVPEKKAKAASKAKKHAEKQVKKKGKKTKDSSIKMNNSSKDAEPVIDDGY